MRKGGMDYHQGFTSKLLSNVDDYALRTIYYSGLINSKIVTQMDKRMLTRLKIFNLDNIAFKILLHLFTLPFSWPNPAQHNLHLYGGDQNSRHPL